MECHSGVEQTSFCPGSYSFSLGAGWRWGLCGMWRAQGTISHNGAALLVRMARRAHDKRGWERFGSPGLGN